jgi:hypothetical protein
MHQSLILWTVAAVFTAFPALTGCKTRQNQSKTKELVAETNDPNAKHILVMSAARVLEDSEMYHYRKLLGQMKSAFFEAVGNSRLDLVEGYKQTREQILTTLETAARDVGDNGTLIWYMSSHGMGGKLRSFDKMTIESQELVDAIRRGRKDKGPIRRLYIFFDYCNAEVSASDFVDGLTKKPESDNDTANDQGGMSLTAGSTAVRALDLAQLADLHPEEEAMRAAFAQAGPQDSEGGLGLQGDDPLFREALIFSVSPREQVTSRYGFAEAMKDSLTDISSSPKTTLADFLALLVKNIAKTEQPVSGSSPEVKAPQRAVYFALPDNKLLSETLFGKTAANYANAGTACPPWFSRQWTHNRSRDGYGRCYDPAALCKCFMTDDDQKAGRCSLRFSERRPYGQVFTKEQDQRDKDHSRQCYSTCLEIVKEHQTEVANYCGNMIMTINALGRLEAWNVTPKK